MIPEPGQSLMNEEHYELCKIEIEEANRALLSADQHFATEETALTNSTSEE